MTTKVSNADHIGPWVRAGILFASLVVLGAISWHFTGEIVPPDDVDALLVVGTLLFVVLGTLVMERFFTGPGDAFVNSLSAVVVIFPLRGVEPVLAWWLLFSYLLLVAVISYTALILQRGSARRPLSPGLARIQRVAFDISKLFGKARVVYSVVFIVALAFFASTASPLKMALLVFWGAQIAMWSLEIPQSLSRLGRRVDQPKKILGWLDRVDSPHLLRVEIIDREAWDSSPENAVAVAMADGSLWWAVRLASENTAEGVWGTAFLCREVREVEERVQFGAVVLLGDSIATVDDVLSHLRPDGAGAIVGIVREGTTPTRLRVELLPGAQTAIGSVLSAVTDLGPVFYQVVDAETSEESFGSLRYGSHIAYAPSIGALDASNRFDRVDWVPRIGAAVFSGSGTLSATSSDDDGLFVLGAVPGTSLELKGDFVGELESHTAILGVTGSGKTEFAFDLLRHAIDNEVKVICIDLTSQYEPRLRDLAPVQLTIDDDQAKDLEAKLFDVETGEYKASSEKRELRKFAHSIRDSLQSRVHDFLKGTESHLAMIELREVANTQATLLITEMYLSALLKLAKDGAVEGKVLVVIEEAHTVMPEATSMGVTDFDSKATIGKIVQIALQGRKYGVGLLVVAQRTATVSKSVLTQCNTVVSFTCVDDTSIAFLRNVYGSAVAEGLPNLRKLRAVAHGQWVGSGLPVVFDVEYDERKAKRRTWADQRMANSSVAANMSSSPLASSGQQEEIPPF